MSIIKSIQKGILLSFCDKKPQQNVFNDNQKILEYKGISDSEKYFSRYNGKINFTGKRVLDVGCGTGHACFYTVLKGAQSAIGADIDTEYLKIAEKELKGRHPEIADKIKFCHINELSNEKFDIIFSKNSFEHIKKPENFFKVYKRHLVKGGLIAIGFGPPWKAPYGAHLNTMTRFPWIHLLFPKEVVVEVVEQLYGRPVGFDEDGSPSDLNMMTLEKFKRIINESDLECIYFNTNVHKNKLVSLALNTICTLSFLREYFTINIFCVLRLKK